MDCSANCKRCIAAQQGERLSGLFARCEWRVGHCWRRFSCFTPSSHLTAQSDWRRINARTAFWPFGLRHSDGMRYILQLHHFLQMRPSSYAPHCAVRTTVYRGRRRSTQGNLASKNTEPEQLLPQRDSRFQAQSLSSGETTMSTSSYIFGNCEPAPLWSGRCRSRVAS